MTVFIIILLSLVLIFALVIYYFFSIAFVKHNIGDTDDLDDPVNKPIVKYKDTIEKGMQFIKAQNYKWVYTETFDGLILAARYFNFKKDKTVILFHGYRSSALRDFSCAVEMYKNFGFNVLLCDQRSHGKSDGRLITFGIKESYDAKVWADFVNEKYAPNAIVLGGMSMGATTVLLSLSYNLPKTVKAVVADCGFTSCVDIIEKVGKESFKINPRPILPFLNIYCKIFGRFSIFGKSTADTVRESQIPVMLIHGKNDGFVPCEMSEKTFENTNKNSKILIIDEADHGVSYLVNKEKVEKGIKEFLLSCNI